MSLENKLAKKAEVKDKGLTVTDLIQTMSGQISKALPKHLTPERFARIALTCIRLNPELMNCTQESLIAALMQSAQLGLEPGMLGRCYLIPYANSKTGRKDCQFQIGYLGLVDLAMRSGNIEFIDVHEVCENDEFEYSFGVNGTLTHKPLLKGDKGEVYCYYAIAKLKSGAYIYIVSSKHDMEKHKTKYAARNPIWNKEFDEMAKKTVLKKLCKILPLSPEIVSQIATDETIKKDINQDMTNDSTDVLSNVSDDNLGLPIKSPEDPSQIVDVNFKDSPFE